MRLLNVMMTQAKGGDGLMAANYHEALNTDGFEVLSVGHPEGMLSGLTTSWGYRPLVTHFVNDPLAAFRLAAYTKDFRPDLVIAHGNKAGRLCMMPFVGTGAKTVQVLHSPSSKPHLKRVKAALCVSNHVHEATQRTFPDLKVIDMANFSHLRRVPVKKCPSLRPVIGAMGRLHAIKGFDVLLQSAACLRTAGLDFVIRIAGDGPELSALKNLAERLGLNNHVEFCGWINDPIGFVSSADLFVLPSRYESFGIVLVEAMAAGVPVIASNSEGPYEVLKGGQFGTLFKSQDVSALTSSIASVFSDWQRWHHKAKVAQVYAMQEFGFDAGRKRLRQTIEMLVETRVRVTGKSRHGLAFEPKLIKADNGV